MFIRFLTQKSNDKFFSTINNTQISHSNNYLVHFSILFVLTLLHAARRAGSDGSMSASGSAGPGFDSRRGSKFSFENFQPRG